METYYTDQLNRIEVEKTEYAPTVKLFANGNGRDTNNISLNKESAQALIEWLTTNFIKEPVQPDKIYVDHNNFIELCSKIAQEMTEQHFYDRTYELTIDTEDGEKFTEEAQDFFNEKIEDIEIMINKTVNVYSDTDK